AARGGTTGGRTAKVAVWRTIIPSDDEMKFLTKPSNACSANPQDFEPEGLKVYWPMYGQSPEPDKSGNSNNGNITGSPTLVAGPCSASGKPRANVPAGLLTQSSNGRYFQANGKTIVLAGSHTWYQTQTRSDKAYATAWLTPEVYANWL